MKALVAAACIAVLAAVGYFFWGEYERANRLAEAKKIASSTSRAEIERICDKWVASLESWKASKPDGHAASFADARDHVDKCLKATEGTDWHSNNLSVKYW
jgi:Flp pilus assembly protein TadB